MMPFRCPFLDPHPNHSLKYNRCPFKMTIRIRPAYLIKYEETPFSLVDHDDVANPMATKGYNATNRKYHNHMTFPNLESSQQTITSQIKNNLHKLRMYMHSEGI